MNQRFYIIDFTLIMTQVIRLDQLGLAVGLAYPLLDLEAELV